MSQQTQTSSFAGATVRYVHESDPNLSGFSKAVKTFLDLCPAGALDMDPDDPRWAEVQRAVKAFRELAPQPSHTFMPNYPHVTAFNKTVGIFRELCPKRYRNVLEPGRPVSTEMDPSLLSAISRAFSGSMSKGRTNALAVLLLGLRPAVAFLVALLLFPERFTDSEIVAGVRCFGIDAHYGAIEIAKRLGLEPDTCDASRRPSRRVKRKSKGVMRQPDRAERTVDDDHA